MYWRDGFVTDPSRLSCPGTHETDLQLRERRERVVRATNREWAVVPFSMHELPLVFSIFLFFRIAGSSAVKPGTGPTYRELTRLLPLRALELAVTNLPRITPMQLSLLAKPFDNPDWLFE